MTGKELLNALSKISEEELNKEISISVDVSKGEDDADHRVYASLEEVIVNDPIDIPLICIMTEDNYMP